MQRLAFGSRPAPPLRIVAFSNNEWRAIELTSAGDIYNPLRLFFLLSAYQFQGSARRRVAGPPRLEAFLSYGLSLRTGRLSNLLFRFWESGG